jgi:hypothetical protein
MSSAFLVFDLVGGNTGLESKRNAGGFIHPKFDNHEEAVGLIVGEKSEPSSGGQSFAKGNGAHPNDLPTERQLLAIRRWGYWLPLFAPAVALCSSEFKLKSGINRVPLRATSPFIPF